MAEVIYVASFDDLPRRRNVAVDRYFDVESFDVVSFNRLSATRRKKGIRPSYCLRCRFFPSPLPCRKSGIVARPHAGLSLIRRETLSADDVKCCQLPWQHIISSEDQTAAGYDWRQALGGRFWPHDVRRVMADFGLVSQDS